MMKKRINNDKGFTLIELMAVILLLGIIMSVTTVITLNTIKNSKEKSYNVLVSNIKEAAKGYFEECENNSASGDYLESACNGLIRENGDNCEADKCATISIDSLLKYDFLKTGNINDNKKNIENPITNDNMNICVIELKKYVDENNNYITWYEFETGSSEKYCPTYKENYGNNEGEKGDDKNSTLTSSKVLSNLGLTNSLKNGTPNFAKISPLVTYTQNIANNQTVSLTDNANTVRLGTSISFDSSDGSYTIGGVTSEQTFNSNSAGKYTCGSNSLTCTTAYKVINVSNSGISWDDDHDTVEPACDVEYGTAISFGTTIVQSGTGYKLSGVISSYDAADLHDNPDIVSGWSCCGGTTCNADNLFKVEYYEATGSESGTVWGIYPRDLTVGSAKMTKADVYTATSSKNTADIGIFATTDDLGPSYYFRGDVTNNYVKFAGFYWRIIRINGDGSVRMIYDGTSAHSNGTMSNNRSIGTGAYNNTTNDNTYTGYMYGTPGASTYASTHSNTTNSLVKTTIDNWYKTNIEDKGYSKYVSDAIYCNDRTLNTTDTSYTGIGVTDSLYSAHQRLNTNKKPTLVCAQNNDKFTVSTELGNGKLTYPVGLMTGDEMSMAGGVYGAFNDQIYLYMGRSFWGMTPLRTGSMVTYYTLSGALQNENINETNVAIRPVISLKPDVITGGNGTATNPFIVG